MTNTEQGNELQARENDIYQVSHPFSPTAIYGSAQDGNMYHICTFFRDDNPIWSQPIPPSYQELLDECFWHAASTFQYRTMEFLKSKGANINYERYEGHILSSHISLETMGCLVAYGIDINYQNSDGWTALHYAVFRNDLERVAHIIRLGADMTLELRIGKKALDMLSPEDWKKVQKMIK